MTRTWSVSGRRLMWGQVSGRSGRRLRGRRRGRWKPLVAAPLVGVLLAAGGCSSEGGDDSDVEDVAAASSVDPDTPVEVPVTTEDGRMLQPAGHVGIWFETEPSDPLDRLVWKSQQFVGQPLELEPLGENARTPDSVDLPNVCAPEVFGRLETLGLVRGAGSDVGLEYVVCAITGTKSDPAVRHIRFLWGAATSVDPLLGEDGVTSLDESGVEVLGSGGYSVEAGCIALGRSTLGDRTIFAYSKKLDPSVECDGPIRGQQMIINSIGGYFV